MFLDKVPDVRNAKQVTVLRVKPGRPITGWITGSVIRTMCHWYRSKSLPCLKQSRGHCPLCELGINQRYYAYYSLRSHTAGSEMIELTINAEEQLLDHARRCPNESAMLVTVSRKPGKRNNPIEVAVEYRDCSPEERAALARIDLDKDIMERSLCRLWGLPEWPLSMRADIYDALVEKYIKEVIDGHI